MNNNIKEITALLSAIIPLLIAGIGTIIGILGKNNKKFIALKLENENLKKEVLKLQKDIKKLTEEMENNFETRRKD